MKAEIGYTISRLLYGLFLMWYGINILLSPIHKSELEKVDKTFVDFKNMTDILIPGLLNNMTNIFDLNQLKNNSNSISLLIPYLLIIGGFFCLCGYAASIHFIMCGIVRISELHFMDASRFPSTWLADYGIKCIPQNIAEYLLVHPREHTAGSPALQTAVTS